MENKEYWDGLEKRIEIIEDQIREDEKERFKRKDWIVWGIIVVISLAVVIGGAFI